MANTFTVKTVFGLVDQFTAPADRIKRKMNEIGSSSAKATAMLKQDFADLGNHLKKTVLVAVGLGASIAGATTYFVSAAAEVEQYKTTLVTMLGSQEEANKRFNEMSKFAASTPFEMQDVVQLGNQLQALGRYSVDNMTMLGDLASAAGKPIDQVSGAFAKLASGQKGVAVDMFRDLLISTDDWVKATGKGVDKSGSLLATTEEMMAVLPSILADKGFSGMMENQSKTFNGRLSNMKDGMFQFRAAVGEAMLGPVGDLIGKVGALLGRLTEWANANKELINAKVSHFFEGVGKAFDFIVTAGGKAIRIIKPFIPLIVSLGTAIWAYNTGMKVYKVATTAAAVAQAILNGTMALNPIMIVVVAVAALIGIIIMLVKNWDKVTAALKRAWEAVRRFASELWNGVINALRNLVEKVTTAWDKFKGLSIFLSGGLLLPFVSLVEVIRSVISAWSDITEAFKNEGFFAGIRALGAAILEGLVAPFKAAWELIQKVGGGVKRIFGGGEEDSPESDPAGEPLLSMRRGTPISPNTQTINSNRTTNNYSTVDVNFNNPPAGTTARSRGRGAPRINLNTGPIDDRRAS